MAAKPGISMSVDEVMAYLEEKGCPTTKATFMRHGAPDSFFGVKVGDLKVLQKKIKRDHSLALKLYETGNSDAMYLAGLICDPQAMTKKELDQWVKAAPWYMISEYTVAWTAAESPCGYDVAKKWIDSKQESIASAGWMTLSGIVSLKSDNDLDLEELTELLSRVEKKIAAAPNRVKYAMNGFVISVGSYVNPLSELAQQTARRLGKVEVDMGNTACKVPLATEYIDKAIARGSLSKKRKTVFC